MIKRNNNNLFQSSINSIKCFVLIKASIFGSNINSLRDESYSN
jgi:hypothetical protein